jgi:hypothetical protein
MNVVLNQATLKKRPPNWIYIGRVHGNTTSHFGNPFTSLIHSIAFVHVDTREKSIKCFDDWIHERDYLDVEPERRKWILNNLDLLRGKDLVCWCAPLPCHGDVYLKLLEEISKNEKK